MHTTATTATTTPEQVAEAGTGDPAAEQDLQAITWRLDRCAGQWMSGAELSAVTDWMHDNAMIRATVQHPVVVKNGVITYGSDWSGPQVRAADRDIETVTVALRTRPPSVRHPVVDPAARDALYAVLDQHEWCRPGICVDCSPRHHLGDGRDGFHRSTAVDWPCPAVAVALQTAGLPLPQLPGVAHPRPARPGGATAPAAEATAGASGPGVGEILDPQAARAFAISIRQLAESLTTSIENHAAALRDHGVRGDPLDLLFGMADAMYALDVAAERAGEHFARHIRLADQIQADPSLVGAAAGTYLGPPR